VRFTTPSLPKQLNIIDEDLPERLRAAFAKHPWVQRVEVEIKPPKHIIVNLTHRQPVLAVKVGADLRAVDGDGVLLPRNASTLGLPVYDGDARPPRQDEAGTRWGDPNVEAAARKLKK
jgi:cell division septal protein FtsQ